MIRPIQPQFLPPAKSAEGPLLTTRGAPVRFYQSPSMRPRLQPGQGLPIKRDAPGSIKPNEGHFQIFYPLVRDMGGIILGIGSLQNMNLAVAAPQASGLIFVDFDSMPALTLPLLLSQIPDYETPEEFAAHAKKIVLNGEDPAPFLEKIPEEYRPAFAHQIESLRERAKPFPKRPDFKVFPGANLLKLLNAYLQDPNTFLGDKTAYRSCTRLVQNGGTAIIHGDLFGDETPPLVAQEMAHHHEPIRIIYTSNALEWAANNVVPPLIGPFLNLLEGPFVDPAGLLLMTALTEGGVETDIFTGAFAYYAVPIKTASRILRHFGNFEGFVDHFKTHPELRLAPSGSADEIGDGG